MQDVVSGWPNEMFEPYAAYVYNVFQRQNEVPLWFEPFLHSAQRRWQRRVLDCVAAVDVLCSASGWDSHLRGLSTSWAGSTQGCCTDQSKVVCAVMMHSTGALHSNPSTCQAVVQAV